MAISELTLLLKIKDEATQALQRFSGSLGGSFDDAVKASKYVALGLAGAGVAAVGFGALAVKSASDAEKQWALVGNQVKLAGLDFDGTLKTIQSFATQTQKLTGISDEYTGSIVGRLLPSVKDVNKAIELTKIALDMEASGMMSAESATKALALANAGEIDMLKRYIPELKLLSTEQLENMSATERSELAIKALKEQFGGAAEAAGNTFAGQMNRAKESLGNTMEIIGGHLLPTLTKLLEHINQFIEDVLPRWIEKIKEVINWFREHQIVLVMVAGGILGALIPAFMALAITIITSTIPAFIALAISLAPFIIGGAIIGGLIAGIYYIITHWELIKQKAIEIWDAIKAYFKEVWDGIKIIFSEAAQSLTDKWTAFKNFWVELWNAVKNSIAEAYNWIKGKVDAIIDSVNRAITAASNLPGVGMVKSAVEAVRSTVSSIGRAIGVKDAIISPRGDIITTDPMDYLIATKNPMGLSGGGIVINITGNSFMGDRDVARKLGNELVSYLKMNMRI